MKKMILIFSFLPLFCIAQTDVIILLRHGAHLRTYTPGMAIQLETVYNQWLGGTITIIRHDSLFLDGIPFHYKEIMALKRDRTKLNYATDGILLMIAGGGVLVLGAVNGLIRSDPPKYWYTPASFITAGSLLGLGIFLRASRSKQYLLGKKYSLEYLAVSPLKN
jgi:hypothetical protein